MVGHIFLQKIIKKYILIYNDKKTPKKADIQIFYLQH